MRDAAYINLEIEALYRRTREMPGQTSRDGSAAYELVGKEQMDVEDPEGEEFERLGPP